MIQEAGSTASLRTAERMAEDCRSSARRRKEPRQALIRSAPRPLTMLRPDCKLDSVVMKVTLNPALRLERGTFTPERETLHAFKPVPSAGFASEIRDLASPLARLQFSEQPTENTKRREVAARESFSLAGPTGLEPATSGVTDRRSKCQRREGVPARPAQTPRSRRTTSRPPPPRRTTTRA
jgi:hypothetical protein